MVRLIGHPSAPSGMGEHARSVALSLAAAGVAVELVDVYAHWPMPHEFARVFSEELARFDTGTKAAPSVDIDAVNADEVHDVQAAVAGRFREAPVRIAFPHWELPRFPEHWVEALSAFDTVWAASAFTHRALVDSGVTDAEHVGLACRPPRPAFVTRRSPWPARVASARPQHAASVLLPHP